MRSNLVIFLLLILRSFTATVSAPYDVSVTCDSYGVVVNWKSTDRSQETEFDLELKDDDGEVIHINTTSHQYNISNLLKNTAYNRYYVTVTDQGLQNGSAESLIFSFADTRLSRTICGLEFPPVKLLPYKGQLNVTFVNPLRLYEKTPALRNVMAKEKLHYIVKSVQSDSMQQTSDEFICSSDSEICMSSLIFPEEQEKYCVTLSGTIRQTRVNETEPVCYSGTLNPGLPVYLYIILLLASLLVLIILLLAMMFLIKAVKRKIKEKHLSKIPPFLENWLVHTLITPLHTESEPAVEIPKVAVITSTNTCELWECANLLETSANREPILDSSGEKSCQDAPDQYRTFVDQSSSGFSMAYDRPHALVEMSSGDMVGVYGTRQSLFGSPVTVS